MLIPRVTLMGPFEASILGAVSRGTRAGLLLVVSLTSSIIRNLR
jgi:hypothetical protein